MTDKLANVGLIPKREPVGAVRLGEFVDSYIAGRTDAKPSTATVWRRSQKHLVAFFGADRDIRTITAGEAKDFRRKLLLGLSDNTVRRTCGIAKQFCEDAVDRGLIGRNPFKHRDIPTATSGNPSREFFITREMAEKVFDACPDAQWRLLFALSRYGGLRCPSEHLALRWGDIDWERGRINVSSSKTAHHVGGESRTIPLFPELRPYLDECYELAQDGEEFVITRYREANSNLRTQLLRIIKRAGLKGWPKLFQNLRSTRETELAEDYPMHVVCAWLGNSQPVAMKHYLQLTDEHFEKAVQNPVQQVAVSGRGDSQSGQSADDETLVLQGRATECDYLPESQVGDTGLEPVTSSV
ncbi:tyrosine-type recombinase/integrase [Symmachiella dynata]|uniref:tyrosine-type recombinase/integrase n=1 Tax=Symmachiella dynata TaxID=2527995 RepID=UPI003B8398E8